MCTRMVNACASSPDPQSAGRSVLQSLLHKFPGTYIRDTHSHLHSRASIESTNPHRLHTGLLNVLVRAIAHQSSVSEVRWALFACVRRGSGFCREIRRAWYENSFANYPFALASALKPLGVWLIRVLLRVALLWSLITNQNTFGFSVSRLNLYLSRITCSQAYVANVDLLVRKVGPLLLFIFY